MPAVLPAVIGVGDNLAFGINGSAHLCDLRRAKIVPAHFIPAHELDAHGPPSQLRHNGGGLRRVLIAAMAVRARSFVILDAYPLHRHSEQRRQHFAGGVDVLR